MTKDPFKIAAVTLSLRDMFTKHYFCICTVDKCMKIMGSMQSQDFDSLSALHCVHWRDMPDDFRKEVVNRTLRMVFNAEVDLDMVERAAIDHMERHALPAHIVEAKAAIETPETPETAAAIKKSSPTFWDRLKAFVDPVGAGL